MIGIKDYWYDSHKKTIGMIEEYWYDRHKRLLV